ncbi:DUF6230 family protein [Gandjariella thermophila]|uniref:Cholesterol esterase n=1 Tax=Gandjariella thermophila TaxID=1931992 RepID=A0A4D4JBH2_9PSEU|nr:DUF6230 family protein [Gandjariella thermophila]GDY31786.1 cholesterol esterase [Gandjariella thermophila]
MVEATGTQGGRIRWRRFLAVFAAAVISAGGLMFGMARGALAVSFAVAGMPFKVSADLLQGFGFVTFGAVDRELTGRLHPVQVNAFRQVTLYGFCQSIVTPHVPFIGDVTLLTTAPSSTGVNLVTDLEFLAGDVTYNNVDVNIDASTVFKGPPGVRGVPGTSGAQANAVTVRNLRNVAWATTAGTLHQPGMVTRVLIGRHECF